MNNFNFLRLVHYPRANMTKGKENKREEDRKGVKVKSMQESRSDGRQALENSTSKGRQKEPENENEVSTSENKREVFKNKLGAVEWRIDMERRKKAWTNNSNQEKARGKKQTRGRRVKNKGRQTENENKAMPLMKRCQIVDL
ncbi:hypothetical protein SRHO_G00309740 [Serrasalmus rhombeus]